MNAGSGRLKCHPVTVDIQQVLILKETFHFPLIHRIGPLKMLQKFGTIPIINTWWFSHYTYWFYYQRNHFDKRLKKIKLYCIVCRFNYNFNIKRPTDYWRWCWEWTEMSIQHNSRVSIRLLPAHLRKWCHIIYF